MEIDGAKIRAGREAVKARTNGRLGSQAWLAARIGAHPTSVSDWERGDTQPSLRHLRGISDALGVQMEDLYVDSPEVERHPNPFRDLNGHA